MHIHLSSIALTFTPVVLLLVEKKKETITESAGRQQKKKIGKSQVYKSMSFKMIMNRLK